MPHSQGHSQREFRQTANGEAAKDPKAMLGIDDEQQVAHAKSKRARRSGPFTFLLMACAPGFCVRYLLLVVYPQHGFWVLGGFAICRLPEFALGMALGMWHKQSPARLEWFLLRGVGLLAGLLLYPAALWLYHNGITYVFVDFATGACCLLEIVGVAGNFLPFFKVAQVFALVCALSYRLYLLHSPY